MTNHRSLFDDITPYATGFLNVGDGHEIYWEQSGNPDGTPIVFLHGGPGAGTSPMHRRFFDPDHYRIILFDQRGCGRSTPFGSVENNTRMDLVGDIEKLRTHLSIDQWIVFGGSWGSTLALSYAAHHADHCKGLILRGIFLCEPYEIDWFLNGMQTVFPEAWERFSNGFKDKTSQSLLKDYYALLTGDDETAMMQAAARWEAYESECAMLLPTYKTAQTDEEKQHALTISRIEAHYFLHDLFTDENSLLTQIDAFRHVPAVIVQGRYDMVCPIISAHKLHTGWPEADYIIVPDAGHSAFDPPLRSRLIDATENFKTV